MRKIIPFFIFLLLGQQSFSQTNDTIIPFVAYWSIGDSYSFNVTKSVEQWSHGEQTKDEEYRYVARFEVVDSTATLYTIKWSYQNDLMNTYGIPAELMDQFEQYALTEIEYTTTELGELVEILNWQEIASAMNQMIDDIIDVQSSNDPELRKTLTESLTPFKEAYSSKESVELLMLKELQYFHSPMGYEYSENDKVEYDDELPNMFGGKPIKAKGSLRFEDHDPKQGYCVLIQELKLDPDDTMNMLRQVFKSSGLDDKGVKDMMKTAIFEINDVNTFEYFYNPGIPLRIETVRETNMVLGEEARKRIDRIIIEMF